VDVTEVEERDSSWEVEQPAFRVYVFDDHHTTWTYDIRGGQVLDVIRWAQDRCSHEERFAIALVHEDRTQPPAHRRGLIWLLGADANIGSPDIWQAQQLAAMSRRRCRRVVLDE
jgi:hypothetical protein